MNSTTARPQFQPAIGMDAEGDFTIAWANGTSMSFYNCIRYQRFDLYGDTLGGEIQVSPSNTDVYFQPTVCMSTME